MSQSWSIEEVSLIVNDYFDMLIKELSWQVYNKTEHRKNLSKILNRSNGSIEFKHQNISAVLIELGYPYIRVGGNDRETHKPTVQCKNN